MKCPKCESEDMDMQVQATIQAPASMARLFSKANLRKKEVCLLGVNWETADYICNDCGYVIDGYGNYVSKMEKALKEFKEEVLSYWVVEYLREYKEGRICLTEIVVEAVSEEHIRKYPVEVLKRADQEYEPYHAGHFSIYKLDDRYQKMTLEDATHRFFEEEG